MTAHALDTITPVTPARPARRLRADAPAAGRREYMPDAEIHWPSIDSSAHAGQAWAIEAELTPKPVARTAAFMEAAA